MIDHGTGPLRTISSAASFFRKYGHGMVSTPTIEL
jgi:hypothetical protein